MVDKKWINLHSMSMHSPMKSTVITPLVSYKAALSRFSESRKESFLPFPLLWVCIVKDLSIRERSAFFSSFLKLDALSKIVSFFNVKEYLESLPQPGWVEQYSSVEQSQWLRHWVHTQSVPDCLYVLVLFACNNSNLLHNRLLRCWNSLDWNYSFLSKDRNLQKEQLQHSKE